jgi:hypothetical protein
MSRRTLLLILVLLACNAAAFAQSCPPGNSWCSGTFAYDAMGNIRAIGADTYVYDTAGRLVAALRTGIGLFMSGPIRSDGRSGPPRQRSGGGSGPGTDKSVCHIRSRNTPLSCQYRGQMWHRHSCLCPAAQPRVGRSAVNATASRQLHPVCEKCALNSHGAVHEIPARWRAKRCDHAKRSRLDASARSCRRAIPLRRR